MPVECRGLAVMSQSAPFTEYSYTIRDLRSNDVEISVKYSGICHTDMHMMDNDWKCSQYPLVPGHEVAGVVTRVGESVTKLKVGDHVGVGYYCWSCRNCDFCKTGQENYCPKAVQNYGFAMPDGEITMGGFANKVVVAEEFAVPIPSELPLEFASPLLCAGITCWSPMKYCKMDTPGKRIGVVGLGGLGHCAVKFGVAFGNEVTVISTSRGKETLAKELGATHFCVSTDPESVKSTLNSLDYIVDTVSADKNMDLYLSLLRTNGVLVTVGLPEVSIALKVSPMSLVFGRKSVMGSIVGSVSEQEEMMKFCAEKQLKPMIEIQPANQIQTCFERLKKNDVRFRFVLDFTTF